MSRTDVHRPCRVQERDPHVRHEWRIHHRHWHLDDWDDETKRWLLKLSVPCDLHEYLASPVQIRTRCTLVFVGARRLCACRLCARQHERKYRRRQQRARWRNQRQQALAELRAGHDDVDIPPIRGSVR